jgi:iron complex outermembrane receptor protein
MRKKKSGRPSRHIGLSAGLVLAASSGALAQDAQVQDVVVTAPETTATVSEVQAKAFQDKPQAVNVITQRQIEALNITSLQQAQRLAPSLQFRFSNVRNLTFNIRGFGAASSGATDGIFGGVPIYIDGVYQPRPGQAVFDIPDLVGIEVMKGPQSTGGGQDSTGGAVRIQTALPSFVPQVTGLFQYGNYNNIQVQASATGPIAETDWAAFRVAIFGQDRDGYISNYQDDRHFNDWHSKGARAQFLFQPNPDVSARIVFDYSHVNQACCRELPNGVVTTRANGAPVRNNFFDRVARLNYSPPSYDALGTYMADARGYQQTAQESYGAAAIIDYHLNGFTLSSISSFRGWDFHPNNRTRYVAPELITNGNGHVSERSAVQEVKVVTPAGHPVEGLAGVFFLYEQLNNWGLTTWGRDAGAFYGPPANSLLVNNAALVHLGRYSYDNPETVQVAPYAQAVWHATPELDLTAGLRYSYNSKNSIFRQFQFGGADLGFLSPAERAQAIAARNAQAGVDREFSASTHQGLLSALASASYKFTPDVIGYVTYARGGRAGGPNPVSNLPAAVPTTVLAEELDDYEVGIKSTWFDGRLLANIAAFVMVDHNYITTVTESRGAEAVSFLANAKRAVSRGVELDVRAQPWDNLFLYGSLTYDDTFYGSFANAACPFEQNFKPVCDATGQPLSLTPKWAFVVGGEYYHRFDQIEALGPQPLIGYVGADFTYQSSFFSNPDNSIYSVIPAYGLLNVHAGVRFEDSSWDLQGWIQNALDKRYFITLSPTALPGGLIGGNVGIPLTFGITLRAKV